MAKARSNAHTAMHPSSDHRCRDRAPFSPNTHPNSHTRPCFYKMFTEKLSEILTLLLSFFLGRIFISFTPNHKLHVMPFLSPPNDPTLLGRMDLRQKLDFLKKECEYKQLILQNIVDIVDIAPRELVERQIQLLERSQSLHLPKESTTSTTILDYFIKESPGHVYVLRLQGDDHAENYYYVGFTQDLSKRLYDHFHGDGATWTKLHPPLHVMKILEGEKAEERATTISMMKTYGWQTVRGYCWCSQHLKAPPRELS